MEKYLMRKARNVVIIFLLCLSALGICGTSSAHALQSTLEGVSNTCRWQYVRLSDKEAGEEAYVLSISPLEGWNSAALGLWKADTPPWRSRETDNYRKKTVRIEIEGRKSKRPVSALTCRGMFYGFPKVKTADLSGLDTSCVRDMSKMFYKCEELTSISGIDGFNTAFVNDMSEMFSHCHALRLLEVETWATNAVMKMDQLFFKCHALEALNLRKWDVSSVVSMEKMFAHCHALTTVGDIGKWSVARVSTMSDMFHGCSSLVELDMSGWVLSGSAITRGIFHKTEHLQSIHIGPYIKIKKNTEFSSAGSKVGSGTYWVAVGDGTTNNPRGRVFPSSDALRNFHNDINNRGGDNAEHYVRLKICRGTSGDCVWEYLPCDEKDLRGNTTYLLRIHPSLGKNLGTLGRWNKTPPWHEHKDYRTQTTKVEIKHETEVYRPVKARTCLNMFSCFTKLKEIDVSGLDVKNVTDMRKMFRGCRALQSLDLSTWNISDGVKMKKMFEQTWSLRAIRLGASFRIKDEAILSDAGSRVGTHWAQVGTGGIYGPAGRTFASAKYLAIFHHDRTQRKTDVEQYARITVNLCVIFDKAAPDASGFMDSQLFNFLEEKALTQNAYERRGYKFNGWKDNLNISYKDGQLFKNTVIEFNAQKFLSAQWKPIKYTMAFNANVPATETVIAVPDKLIVKYGQDVKIPADVLIRDGYEFLCWTTNADGTGERYYPDTEIRGVTGDIVLYAQWVKRISTANQTPKQKSQKKDLEPSRPPVAHESTREVQEFRPTPRKRLRATGWYNHDGNIFYNKNGKKLTGWQELAGTIQNPSSPRKSWFYFDKNGAALVGQHELVGGLNQEMHWFYFDETTGEQIRGWKYIDYQDKWCYYSLDDGTMLKGQHELEGGDSGSMNWFYFDEVTGAELRNSWKEIPSQKKTCYYGSDGVMYKGWHEVDGKRYYFDEITGALA